MENALRQYAGAEYVDDATLKPVMYASDANPETSDILSTISSGTCCSLPGMVAVLRRLFLAGMPRLRAFAALPAPSRARRAKLTGEADYVNRRIVSGSC